MDIYEVYTVTYNRDKSPNNEILEGKYTDKTEALNKAKQVNGEVRYYFNPSDYTIIE